MDKPLLRIIALLLVPCLIADPTSVSAFSSQPDMYLAEGQAGLFNEQAVVAQLVDAFLRPSDWRSVRVVRLRPRTAELQPTLATIGQSSSVLEVKDLALE